MLDIGLDTVPELSPEFFMFLAHKSADANLWTGKSETGKEGMGSTHSGPVKGNRWRCGEIIVIRVAMTRQLCGMRP